MGTHEEFTKIVQFDGQNFSNWRYRMHDLLKYLSFAVEEDDFVKIFNDTGEERTRKTDLY